MSTLILGALAKTSDSQLLETQAIFWKDKARKAQRCLNTETLSSAGGQVSWGKQQPQTVNGLKWHRLGFLAYLPARDGGRVRSRSAAQRHQSGSQADKMLLMLVLASHQEVPVCLRLLP